VIAALIEAVQAKVNVQVLVDYSKVKSRRFKTDDAFLAAGVPTFKDREEFETLHMAKKSLFSGIKVGSLMHNKMRLFQTPSERVLLTGSLNPGKESMDNDET
jgi:phosphatidylserine/phosphatidylglycerophosphate/cardiolipin synthase-like enzyme